MVMILNCEGGENEGFGKGERRVHDEELEASVGVGENVFSG